MAGRIITSLLDLDFYKLTMKQVVWRRYRDVPVEYALTNRTKSVRLAERVDIERLRTELNALTRLELSSEDIEYLRESKFIPKGLFRDDFLEFLRRFSLSEEHISIDRQDGQLDIRISGPWAETILWETLVLSIVNELYCLGDESVGNLHGYPVSGGEELGRKVLLLKKYPGIKFADFGTRRRYSGVWQDHIVCLLKQALPNQFLGTASVHHAKRNDVAPIGTFAHEMFMVLSGIRRGSDKELRGSQMEMLRAWRSEYGDQLSVALTDTYGTDAFFQDFAQEEAQFWKCLRQDSGDPFEFGERAISFYDGLDIDPRGKVVVFSDGLNVERIVELHKRFRNRIGHVFGWGTNLTNDVGVKPLSLVMKAVRSNGHGTVKLSDNLAKATGTQEDVEYFKRVFGYTRTTHEECTY